MSLNISMSRRCLAIAAVVTCLSSSVCADQTAVDRKKDEIISKAERLFGQRYTPVTGKPLRLFDEQTETGPPDAVIFWHGSSYVIVLAFASDGQIAKVTLLPEALLRSDYWGDVPETVALSVAEMPWLVESAGTLQPLGKAVETFEAPDGWFQSGPNLYCADNYELASVSHYHNERADEKRGTEVALRDIEILYKQSVTGVVEDVRVDGSQRQLRVAGQWYHGEKPGAGIFAEVQIGAAVRLVTYGCTANEKVCLAVADRPKSDVAEH